MSFADLLRGFLIGAAIAVLFADTELAHAAPVRPTTIITDPNTGALACVDATTTGLCVKVVGGSAGNFGTAVTPTDRGGTVATGGTAVTAIALNANRKGCWIENPNDATENLFVSSTASATTSSGTPNDADLSPGQSYACNQSGNVIQSAISVNAVTSGHKFEAKETQ